MQTKFNSISDLNLYIKKHLELDSYLRDIIVTGELQGFNKNSRTGNYFFNLIDKEGSQIPCAIFAYSDYRDYSKNFKDGDLVEVNGKITYFNKKGSINLTISSMKLCGDGDRLFKKQQLLEKLYKEGLFDASRKRNLPLFPKKIGVITSADGAAIEDIRKNLFNRTKRVELYLFPCIVQGNDAKTSIKNAILRSLDYDIDVLIIGRGGGSKEDLSAFDDEHLARLIAEYPKPVISAIGHEIDKSVIDYVSDLSVSTPTAAANKVVFDDSELLESINEFNSNINLYMQSKINEYKTKLNHLSDFSFFKDYSSYFNKLKIDIEKTEKILNNYWIYTKNQLLDKISSKEEILGELNPYNILDKGYSIIYDKNNNVLSKINDIKNQEELIIRVKDGTVKFGGKDKWN